MGNLKVQVERILQRLAIQYPIKTKVDFLKAIKADVPDICDTGKQKLSLRGLIKLLREADFPLHSDHEAAELLAAFLPPPRPLHGIATLTLYRHAQTGLSPGMPWGQDARTIIINL